MTSEPPTEVEWTEALSVGVPELDDDHRRLVGVINRVLESERRGESVQWAIQELTSYANEHFAREERLMAEAGYPGLDAHREQHRAFIEWLTSVKTAYGADAETRHYLAKTVREYLQNWLTDHIMETDMDYKGYLG